MTSKSRSSPLSTAASERATPVAPVAPAKGSVRRVLVVTNPAKEAARAYQARLVPWLEEQVERVELESDVRELCRKRAALDRQRARTGLPDLVVVLGGDGAILGAVRAFAEDPVPTLGINFGRVGFLASTPATYGREALAGVLAGEGVLEPRMRLEASLEGHGASVRAIALNDVVVSRGAVQGMLTVGLDVGADWVTDYRADGLIVATPSGSTAHSLSAGGPVLFPSMLALVVTPICPQGLAYRPLVLHPESELVLTIKSSAGITTVAVDGQGFFPLRQGDRVRIARHPIAYPLLAWSALDAYRRLRERLGWTGQIAPGAGGPEPSEGTDSGHGGVL